MLFQDHDHFKYKVETEDRIVSFCKQNYLFTNIFFLTVCLGSVFLKIAVNMKWSRTLWSSPPPPCPLSTFCTWKNLSQTLIREVRKCRNKANGLTRWNNNSLVIKHIQGPLVPPLRAIYNILNHILWAVL